MEMYSYTINNGTQVTEYTVPVGMCRQSYCITPGLGIGDGVSFSKMLKRFYVFVLYIHLSSSFLFYFFDSEPFSIISVSKYVGSNSCIFHSCLSANCESSAFRGKNLLP